MGILEKIEQELKRINSEAIYTAIYGHITEANYTQAIFGAVTERHITNKKENRLVTVSPAACVPSAAKLKIEEGLFVGCFSFSV